MVHSVYTQKKREKRIRVEL